MASTINLSGGKGIIFVWHVVELQFHGLEELPLTLPLSSIVVTSIPITEPNSPNFSVSKTNITLLLLIIIFAE